MKTTFKKLAIAAGTTAALAGSMSAHAILQGLPGEAQLVPFVYSSAGDATLGGAVVNTIVRFVVPVSVGSDTLTNFVNPNVVQNPPGAQNTVSPGIAPISGSDLPQGEIHWIVMNNRSVEVDNGTFPVSPDDVHIFDLTRDSGIRNPGYLLAVTSAGYDGGNANFSFFADAWMSMADPAGTLTPALYSIPTLAMGDSADTSATPSLYNEVVENGGQPATSFPVSPIASGIRTSGANRWRAFDVTLLSRAQSGAAAVANAAIAAQADQSYTNLLVLWNDENRCTTAGCLAGNLQGYYYDENEASRSMPISMPNELNLIQVNQGGNVSSDATSTTGLLGTLTTSSVAMPVIAGAENTNGPQGSGFLKVFVNNNASGQAMMAFTMPIRANNGANSVIPVADPYAHTFLPHDRGTYTSRAN